MTKYEWMRWFTFPIMTTHLNKVRSDLKCLINKSKSKNTLSILDVGGRKSPYSIGLDADITLLDVPQESHTQEALNLGFTSDLNDYIQSKRSNIKGAIIEDMCNTNLDANSFDAVVCVEVIEHVVEDDVFVENIAKVIKEGGWAYFTTPNGDYIKNEGPDKNPDHVRHYTKEELRQLLLKYFDKVEVVYAVRTGYYRVAGLNSYSLKKPLRSLKSASSNIINRFQSKNVEKDPDKTAHLIATVYKGIT